MIRYPFYLIIDILIIVLGGMIIITSSLWDSLLIYLVISGYIMHHTYKRQIIPTEWEKQEIEWEKQKEHFYEQCERAINERQQKGKIDMEISFTKIEICFYGGMYAICGQYDPLLDRATIDIDRILKLSKKSNIDFDLLLSFIISHEQLHSTLTRLFSSKVSTQFDALDAILTEKKSPLILDWDWDLGDIPVQSRHEIGLEICEAALERMEKKRN